MLAIVGLAILLLCSLLQNIPPPPKGEYFYSSLLKNNFTLITKIVFVIVGFLIGFFGKLNPFYAGISLILIFPITAIVEGSVYPGSHNLIPFEFIYHLWLALPSIAAIFLGKLLSTRFAKEEENGSPEHTIRPGQKDNKGF